MTMNTTPRDQLAAHYAIELISRGNKMTDDHKDAVRALCGSISDMIDGTLRGRFVIGAQTGFGKSVSLRSIALALFARGETDRHGLLICGSLVEGLIKTKRDLIAEAKLLGVEIDPEKIGVLHAYEHDARNTDPKAQREGFASEKSIEYEDAGKYAVLLVTHARIRSNQPLITLRRYGDGNRTVLFDESWVKSESLGMRYAPLRRSLSEVLGEVEALGLQHRPPFDSLAMGREFIEVHVERMLRDGVTEDVLRLPELTTTPDAAVSAIRKVIEGKMPEGLYNYVNRLAGREVRVLATPSDSGKALLQYRRLIDPAITDVIVTDASFPARKLCQLDTTLLDGERHLPRFKALRTPLRKVKSWRDVTFHRMRFSGGRSKLQAIYWEAADKGEVCWLSREIARVIRDVHPDKRVLIAGFKHRDGHWCRALGRMERNVFGDLKGDLAQLLGDDYVDRWVSWMTFGEADGSNDFRTAEVCFLHGVLLRDRKVELKAAALGQVDDLRSPKVTNELTLELEQSEAAHVIVQTASRIACREVVGKFAKPAHVYFAHAKGGFRPYADEMTWQAKWVDWPVPLEAIPAGAERNEAEDVQAIRDALRRVAAGELMPSSYRDAVGKKSTGKPVGSGQRRRPHRDLNLWSPTRISSRILKRLAGLEELPSQSFSRRVDQALIGNQDGWYRDLNSIVRGSSRKAAKLFDPEFLPGAP